MIVDQQYFIYLSAILFIIGVCGFIINKKNVITILMSIELMLLAVNINFVTFSQIWHNSQGQIMTIFILTVAAAEAAIGLAILVNFYRIRRTIEVEDINRLKG